MLRLARFTHRRERGAATSCRWPDPNKLLLLTCCMIMMCLRFDGSAACRLFCPCLTAATQPGTATLAHISMLQSLVSCAFSWSHKLEYISNRELVGETQRASKGQRAS